MNFLNPARQPKLKILLLGAALLAGTAVHAPGAVVYLDNLDQPIEDFDVISDSEWWGEAFQTDNSAAAFQLNSVTISSSGSIALVAIATGGEFTPATPASNFQIQIYSDNSLTPGSVLETLGGNGTPSTAGNYTYTSAGLTLLPSTTYWVIASVAAGNSNLFSFDWTNSTAHSGAWSFVGYSHTIDSGVAWDPIITDEPFLLSVSATAVPEPGQSALIFGMLVSVLVAWRRTRRL